MIDSAWFYQQLDREGRSLRAMARELGLDPSAVSRMLRGERKMSADEQDGIAAYLGVSLFEVAARRRGDAAGFAAETQEGYVPNAPRADLEKTKTHSAAPWDADPLGGLNLEATNFYDRVRGCMKGTITIAPGVDLTEPADPEWAKVYDD
jgi:transcriptional regulator with XRE-family HTH domain